MSDFYTERDQRRINAALTALRSVENKSESLDDVIQVLSGENNEAHSVSEGNSDFLDETAVYQCLGNLIREVHDMQQKIRSLRFDLECEKFNAERRKKSIADLYSQIDRKQDRRKWWFA